MTRFRSAALMLPLLLLRMRHLLVPLLRWQILLLSLLSTGSGWGGSSCCPLSLLLHQQLVLG